MREAFEASILDKPDESAGYAAYADWLQEQGDPRGEFIAVQLALEDGSRPASERKALQERERELLAAHEREWLGPLAPFFLDRETYDPTGFGYGTGPEYIDRRTKPITEHQWQKGFLHQLVTNCLTVTLAHALADSRASRFLQRLHIVSPASNCELEDYTTSRRVPVWEEEYRYFNEWLELLGVPMLRNLRVFQMGDANGEPAEDGMTHNHTYVPGIERLIAEMSRIEELHLLCKSYASGALFALPNLTNLRVLRMHALGEPHAEPDRYEIPLDILAQNPTLGKLTHLMLHPHYGHQSFIPLSRVAPVFHSPHLKSLVHLQLRLSDMGNDGVREIISSGILKRLKWLDLRHGCITDAGARLLARCRDARKLDRLDLSRNAVTPAGLAVLRKAKINAIANNPLTDEELADQQYLREGDFE